MSPAAIANLLVILSFGGAVLSQPVGATPRQEDDSQALRALGSAVPSRTIATLTIRRVAIADPDRDGVVSAAEARQYYDARFALMDRDRDRRLSEAEFFRVAMSLSLQAQESSLAARPRGFAAVDVNGSGALTPEEFLRADGLRRSWAIGAEPDAGRRSVFDAVDANGDGAIGKEEFMNTGIRQFSGSDADGNGRVTIAEFDRGKSL